MSGLSWLADSFAALMLATSAYCLSRLAVSWRHRRPSDHQVDAVHVLMGVAMAGMLVPSLRFFWVGGWEIVFGAGAILFGWRMISDARAKRSSGHHLQHVLACVAMVYMLAAATSVVKAASGGSMGGMGGGPAHFDTLALVLALALFGYVVWTADRFSSLAPVAALKANLAPAVALVPAASVAATQLSATSAGEPLAGPATSGAASAGDPGSARQSPAGSQTRVPLSPRLAACCEIAMGVTMGYMLIMML
jgi:Domain of unknown function (DUF5134)